jgi:hypothetical protein
LQYFLIPYHPQNHEANLDSEEDTNGMLSHERYHGKIECIIGWQDVGYLVMKLAHAVQCLDEGDDGYTVLDSHCERVTMHSDESDSEPVDWHFLELNLPIISHSLKLTQFNPDFRGRDAYFVNMYDGAHVLDMGNFTSAHLIHLEEAGSDVSSVESPVNSMEDSDF